MPSDILQPTLDPHFGEPIVAPAALNIESREETTLGLVELLLKQPARVDELSRQPAHQRELFPRLLLVAQASYLVYGVVMLLVLNLAPPDAVPRGQRLAVPPASWHDGSAVGLPLAYNIGLLLASCVCLPSFYFYSLLAEARLSWLQIALVVAKGTAANAVLLLGILPIYVAVAMGLIVFAAPTEALQIMLLCGLLLPLVSGLWGLQAIYQGVLALAANPTGAGPCRRTCFLRRMTFAWAAVYTAVVPVMIYRLWEYFAAGLQGL
jgi:hypothetical protein